MPFFSDVRVKVTNRITDPDMSIKDKEDKKAEMSNY